MCELSFLPLRPGALEEAEVAEFVDEGMINGAGEVRRKKGGPARRRRSPFRRIKISDLL